MKPISKLYTIPQQEIGICHVILSLWYRVPMQCRQGEKRVRISQLHLILQYSMFAEVFFISSSHLLVCENSF